MVAVCLLMAQFSLGLILLEDPDSVPAIPETTLAEFPLEVRTEIQQALEQLQQAPNTSDLAAELAILLHANGHLSVAEPFYLKALRSAPDDFRWLYYWAVLLDSSNRPDAALDVYRKARGIDRGYVPLTLRLADLLAASGNLAEATPLYSEVLDLFPELAVAHFGLGRAFQQQGRNEDALRHLERACTLHPTYGAAHYALAQELRRAGRPQEAQHHLEMYQRYRLNRAVIGDSLLTALERRRTGSRRALDLLRDGVAAGERGDHLEAIRLNREALQLAPDLLQASVNLMILLGTEGRHDEQQEVYEEAAVRNPAADDLHYNFGVALYQRDQFVAAAEAFRRTLQINPLHPHAHNNLGTILQLEGKYNEAEGHFRAALHSRPDFRLARFNLGRLFLARGRLDAAIDEFEQIKSPEDRETARYLYGLAAALVRKGELSRALIVSEQALELARRFEQAELISALERDIARLPRAPK
jgi:tetratricopeptide (TPR) repeat protein